MVWWGLDTCWLKFSGLDTRLLWTCCVGLLSDAAEGYRKLIQSLFLQARIWAHTLSGFSCLQELDLFLRTTHLDPRHVWPTAGLQRHVWSRCVSQETTNRSRLTAVMQHIQCRGMNEACRKNIVLQQQLWPPWIHSAADDSIRSSSVARLYCAPWSFQTEGWSWAFRSNSSGFQVWLQLFLTYTRAPDQRWRCLSVLSGCFVIVWCLVIVWQLVMVCETHGTSMRAQRLCLIVQR